VQLEHFKLHLGKHKGFREVGHVKILLGSATVAG